MTFLAPDPAVHGDNAADDSEQFTVRFSASEAQQIRAFGEREGRKRANAVRRLVNLGLRWEREHSR